MSNRVVTDHLSAILVVRFIAPCQPFPFAIAAAFNGGWLRTGDLARIDGEGLVYLVDRVKDMINCGDENVYCVEVENALAGAPGIYEAAVLGVPDEMMGETVGAVIGPAPGATFDVTAVRAYLGAHIADFKVPQYVAVSAAPLPRNPGGQLLKRRLRDETDWPTAVRRQPTAGFCKVMLAAHTSAVARRRQRPPMQALGFLFRAKVSMPARGRSNSGAASGSSDERCPHVRRVEDEPHHNP